AAAGIWNRRGLGDVEAAGDYGDWRTAQLDGGVADFYARGSLLPGPTGRAAGSATSSRVTTAILRTGGTRFVPCLRSPSWFGLRRRRRGDRLGRWASESRWRRLCRAAPSRKSE